MLCEKGYQFMDKYNPTLKLGCWYGTNNLAYDGYFIESKPIMIRGYDRIKLQNAASLVLPGLNLCPVIFRLKVKVYYLLGKLFSFNSWQEDNIIMISRYPADAICRSIF